MLYRTSYREEATRYTQATRFSSLKLDFVGNENKKLEIWYTFFGILVLLLCVIVSNLNHENPCKIVNIMNFLSRTWLHLCFNKLEISSQTLPI